ncbi:SDR family NAD(P)-dependent oxidoreductase [Sporosarcina koreensis]|uniref:SDR family NAD(P)-dependent oxidoreductase n=1 Tax=Sporosarcina koreensis TaxID=334735 RepID=A0ABW0U0C0_9BACL
MNKEIVGKVAVITGSAAGIGKGIAQHLLDMDYKLLLVDRNEKQLLQTVDELRQQGGSGTNVQFITGDLTSISFCKTIVSFAKEEFGTVDVLVNCAGIFPSKPALQIEESDWDAVYNLNVKSLFFLTQEVVDFMIANKVKDGSIVNITSTASEVARPGVSHYCSSKAAVKMLTQVLALEFAPYGIRVNAVGPGLVETETLFNTLTNEEAIKEHEEKLSYSPLKRSAKIEEIASAVAFLSGDQATYITGQNLLVDGGYSAGRVYKTFG